MNRKHIHMLAQKLPPDLEIKTNSQTISPARKNIKSHRFSRDFLVST